MNKKIHQSLAMMIDFFQPTNGHGDEDLNDYSPAEYTQLLNRFLAFDEEMSEIACLYKASQLKRNLSTTNRTMTGLIVRSKKKKSSVQNENSTVPSVKTIPLVVEEGERDSNGSSIESGIDGRDGSSVSSVDEYLLENQISSREIPQEQFNDLSNANETMNQQKEETIEIQPDPSIPSEEKTKGQQFCFPKRKIRENFLSFFIEMSSKKSKSSRRKENSNLLSDPLLSLSKGLLPPKPPSSTSSKLQADFRPYTIPMLSNNETSTCPPFLSAKIQSVSFTAGTFGSITNNESTTSSSSNFSRLNVNLRPKSSANSLISFSRKKTTNCSI